MMIYVCSVGIIMCDVYLHLLCESIHKWCSLFGVYIIKPDLHCVLRAHRKNGALGVHIVTCNAQ